MNNRYGYIGRFTAQPGRRDELLAILLRAADMLRSNNECLLYVMGITDEEPDALWSNEIWTSQAAHDAALEPDDVKEAIRHALPLIAGMDTRTEMTVVGGKGI
jgi:quinol monooxygenase YgiN